VTNQFSYSAEYRRYLAVPLGGIGTGTLALGGTGVLKQWQIHNQGNHLGHLPHSFFALRALSVEPPLSVCRVLESPPPEPGENRTPNVNDDLDSPYGRVRENWFPLVQSTVAEAQYPFVRIKYIDDALPADVSLEAFTPFVPLDADASSLPMVSFTFSVTNRLESRLICWLTASLLNAVGWDGAGPIDGSRFRDFGGNRNREAGLAGGTALLLENEDLDPASPGAGAMALWTPDPCLALPQFGDPAELFSRINALKLLWPTVGDDWSAGAVQRALAGLRATMPVPARPSPPGATWAGALIAPLVVGPRETATVEFVIAWRFPNRHADFDQFGELPVPSPPAWLGNRYCVTFADVADVISHYQRHRGELRRDTDRWCEEIFDSALPRAVVDVLGRQPSLIRSPTTFRSADGAFFGFEGMLGESTLNWNGNIGGSCPLNCTHVWNYEQAVASLFPELERSMRDTDWDVLQAPDGYLPHRVRLPLTSPQLFDVPIGGPVRPALDGMLGAVLKTLREAQHGGGTDLLVRRLPQMRRLVDYVAQRWDAAGSGVLTGDQPVTYDISLHGPNMFVGSLWLAALRAMQEALGSTGQSAEAAEFGRRFRASAEAYDGLLYNGEYYAQRAVGEDYDFGAGCLSDQLLGQWWAHSLGLGYLLPPEHVRSALAAIVRHNFREDFSGFTHGYRVFADGSDAGLVICSWPQGGRPSVPVRYADEVWTGVEYQVAAHCFREGLVGDGFRLLEAIRGRYDGRKRNPFNEIECGDHYARAMAGWSVLEAFTGSGYDLVTGRLTLGRSIFRYPLFAAAGWGRVVNAAGHAEFQCLSGRIGVREVRLTPPADIAAVAAPVGPVAFEAVPGVGHTARLDHDVVLEAGQMITITVGQHGTTQS
jgi:non-lysosomal glucosylceramidase